MYRVFFYFLIFISAFFTSARSESLRELSLQEAIYLAVRENPNVIQAQLGHVLDKFSLELQHWEFQPHYSLQASRTTSRQYSVTRDGMVTANASGIEPVVSLLTPIGTQMKLAFTNNISDHYHPGASLEVIQPLMRGFGRPIVESMLNNAIDNEKISRLNIEGTLRDTVTAVINAYLDVISAQRTLEIDQQALARSQLSVQQTKLFIKAGHKAGVELITVQAEVANARTKIENDKNNLQQARYALLTAIGVDPNTLVTFHKINITQLINKYHKLPLEVVKECMLANDIQYQSNIILLNGSLKRSVLSAEDNTRWKLDLTLNASAGGGAGGGNKGAGINSFVNGINQTRSATLNLNIPIDDRQAKVAVATAKIAIREAEMGLKQAKWSKETTAINTWNNIGSAERALRFAEKAESLQLKTYEVSNQKYSHGLIDGLELQTAQQQLVQSQQSVSDARINFLKALVNLDLIIGNTLKTWNVKVRYE